MVVDPGIYIHPVRKLKFCLDIGHNLVCKAVVTFSHGRVPLLVKCRCRLLSLHGGLAKLFRHEHRMVAVSVHYGSLDTNTRLTCRGQDVYNGRWWNCEGVSVEHWAVVVEAD